MTLPQTSACRLKPDARILIVKTSSMGDVIHALPVVSDIRRALPAATIDWMVEAPFAELVHLHPGVHRSVPVALRSWRKQGWAHAFKMRRQLAESLARTPYDLILDLQGLVKSAWLGRTAKGPMVGPGFAFAREPLAAFWYAQRGGWDADAHAVERLRQISAQLLGYHLHGKPDFGVAAPALSQTRTVWFCHGTARAEKAWPVEHWIALGVQLSSMGWKLSLPWGNDAERMQAEQIACAVPNAQVLPKMNLARLSEQMKQAQLVVGVDTGLIHLAAAFELPLVALFFATPQWRYAPRFNPHAISLGDVGRVPSVQEVFAAADRLGRGHRQAW